MNMSLSDNYIIKKFVITIYLMIIVVFIVQIYLIVLMIKIRLYLN